MKNIRNLHFIIHHEHIVAKYFKYENERKIVLLIVNLIKTKVKTHRRFKKVLEELRVNDEIDELHSDFVLGLHCKMPVNL